MKFIRIITTELYLIKLIKRESEEMPRIFTDLSQEVKEEYQNTLALDAKNLYEDWKVAFEFSNGQLLSIIFE